MKSLLDYIKETVDKPRSGDEVNFILKHEIEVTDYPLEADDQFKSKLKKDKTKKSSYHDGEDKRVYEETEDLQELDRNGALSRYVKKVNDIEQTGGKLSAKRKAGKELAGRKRWPGEFGQVKPKVPGTVSEEDLVRTNRADKRAAIVHAIDPKTGKAKTYTRKSATGEIDIGESSETEAFRKLKSWVKKAKQKMYRIDESLVDDENFDNDVLDYHLRMARTLRELADHAEHDGKDPSDYHIASMLHDHAYKVHANSDEYDEEAQEATIDADIATENLVDYWPDPAEIEEATKHFGKYQIDTTAAGVGGGTREGSDVVSHVAKNKRLSKLDISDAKKKVTVKNSNTGEYSTHHVHKSSSADDKNTIVNIRGVGPKGDKHDKHTSVLQHYLSGKRAKTLVESVSSGKIMHKDGTSTSISEDDAKSLNKFLASLDEQNKAKFMKQIESGSKGLKEVITFSKNL